MIFIKIGDKSCISFSLQDCSINTFGRVAIHLRTSHSSSRYVSFKRKCMSISMQSIRRALNNKEKITTPAASFFYHINGGELELASIKLGVTSTRSALVQ